MTRPPEHEVLEINPTRLGLPSGPQSDAASVTNCLLTAQRHANVLAPAMQLQSLPPDHQITFAVLLCPLDGIRTYRRDNEDHASGGQSNGVWYATDGGRLAMHRNTLDQFANAAGIDWLADKCGRTDDRSQPYYWSYRMTCQVKGLDGRMRQVSREYELDLRSSGEAMSPAAAKAGKGLRNARIYGASLCESKAANRAVRAALGLRAYTVEEARLPFVVPVLQWVPPTDDPMIRRLVAAKELGLVSELFGAEIAADRGSVHLVDDARVVDAEPAALPAPDPLQDLPGAAAAAQANASRQAVQQSPFQGADPTLPPWEKPQVDPDLVAYCEAKGWPAPDGPDRVAAVQRHVQGAGRTDYADFLRGRGQ